MLRLNTTFCRWLRCSCVLSYCVCNLESKNVGSRKFKSVTQIWFIKVQVSIMQLSSGWILYFTSSHLITQIPHQFLTGQFAPILKHWFSFSFPSLIWITMLFILTRASSNLCLVWFFVILLAEYFDTHSVCLFSTNLHRCSLNAGHYCALLVEQPQNFLRLSVYFCNFAIMLMWPV